VPGDGERDRLAGVVIGDQHPGSVRADERGVVEAALTKSAPGLVYV
jgi:hypothetical protein